MNINKILEKAKKDYDDKPKKFFVNSYNEIVYKKLQRSTLQKSFLQAMDSAEGTEIIKDMNGEKWVCAINNLKDSWDKDIKRICIDLKSNTKVGSLVYWEAIKFYWLIIFQDYNIHDYFKGEMIKCNYTVKWRDNQGKLQESLCSIQGPAETRAKYDDTRSASIVGRGNDTLTLYMPSEKAKDLYRFDRILVKNRAWRINVIDDISNDGIIRMSLVEDFTNKELDDFEGLVAYNFRVTDVGESKNNYYLVGPSTLTPLDTEIKVTVNSDTNPDIEFNKYNFVLYINNQEIATNNTGVFNNLTLKKKDKIKVIVNIEGIELEYNIKVGGLLG